MRYGHCRNEHVDQSGNLEVAIGYQTRETDSGPSVC